MTWSPLKTLHDVGSVRENVDLYFLSVDIECDCI